MKVRIITDDESMKGIGADAQRCADKGIEVRTDDAPNYHMHNKYMLVDNFESIGLVYGEIVHTVLYSVLEIGISKKRMKVFFL